MEEANGFSWRIRYRETQKYEESKINWKDSEFKWVKDICLPIQRGDISKQFLFKLIKYGNFQSVEEVGSSRKNLISINDVRIQVKASLLWGKGGRSSAYKFQQIRDDDYKILICFGLSPHSAHCWVIEKSSIIDSDGNWLEGRIGKQHSKDSRWLGINPDSVPIWLKPLGGDLDKALEVLKETMRKDL